MLGWTLVLAGALGVGRARAQSSAVWEQMPLFSDGPSQIVYAIDWLVGDGTADPALDTLVVFHIDGTFRYAPGESNAEWDPWHRICTAACDTWDGLVTSEGTLLRAGFGFVRSTNRGATWNVTFEVRAVPIVEVTLPWLRELSGGRAVIVGPVGGAGEHIRSLADGEAGSWVLGGPASDFPESLAEVPPSPALPLGRLLHNGTYVMYSDDGAMTWTLASLGNQPIEGYVKFRFAFYPIAGHPYGGAVFATGCEYVDCDGGGESEDLYRSDDGGASWALVHEFIAAEDGLPFINGIAIRAGVPYVGPDGALWAGVSRAQGGDNPGRIMRSTDEGLTWHRADAGLAESNGGLGWRIYKLHTARDGRMYASTDRGVWRTTQPVVAAEAPALPRSDLSLTVLPNPATGAVTVAVASSSAREAVTIDILDALGRRVAAVHAGPLGAGERTFALDTGAWAPGVYTARVTAADGGGAGGEAHTARFTVAR